MDRIVYQAITLLLLLRRDEIIDTPHKLKLYLNISYEMLKLVLDRKLNIFHDKQIDG